MICATAFLCRSQLTRHLKLFHGKQQNVPDTVPWENPVPWEDPFSSVKVEQAGGGEDLVGRYENNLILQAARCAGIDMETLAADVS